MQYPAYRKPSSVVPGSPELFGTFAGALLRAPVVVVEAVLAWQRQSEERLRLQRLSDHQLRDMGLTREAAQKMARKALWTRCL